MRTAPSNSGPAPSEVLNRRLPRWIRLNGGERLRMEGFTGESFRTDSSDLYLLSRFRFEMELIPVSFLKFRIQTQDARVWWKNQTPYAPPYQDTWDLRLAYVELGNSDKSSGLRVGRQELILGNERLVGASTWSNASRSFDAVRATLQDGRYRLDAFAASVVHLHDGEVGKRLAGDNLHGLYGQIKNLLPGATVEPYLFWRLAPQIKTEEGQISHLNSKTLGIRWKGEAGKGFDYGSDIIRQIGSVGTDRISAWASHSVFGYTERSLSFQPHFVSEYNYASGDHDRQDGRRGTFDQLYPTVHDKYGLADQFGWKNIHHARSGIEFQPRSKIMVSGKYSAFWLADAHDALYSSLSVPIAQKQDGSAGRFVGQELDASALYSPFKHVQYGAGFSHIVPGTFLKRAAPGKSLNYAYLLVSYAF